MRITNYELNNMKNILTIGVSGQVGSFSEEAANYYCRQNKIDKVNIEYLISTEKVLKNLVSQKIDLGIFPIENSNGGLVKESIYAMSRYIFNIKEMFEIDVKQTLMIKPGVKPSEIKTISSHPQALKQCRMYLKRKWPEVELEEYKDTAEAAKDLGEGKLPKTTAIIASKICAQMYDLEILEEAIQDLKFNFTVFIAAERI